MLLSCPVVILADLLLCLSSNPLSTEKKKAQRESCELSFIWGKMRTIARETASQIALRNCSEEVGGKVSIYVILVK